MRLTAHNLEEASRIFKREGDEDKVRELDRTMAVSTRRGSFPTVRVTCGKRSRDVTSYPDAVAFYYSVQELGEK